MLTRLLSPLLQRMRLDDRWKRCREALFVLVSHLPAGSELAIVTFDGSSDVARVNTPPTIITENKSPSEAHHETGPDDAAVAAQKI